MRSRWARSSSRSTAEALTGACPIIGEVRSPGTAGCSFAEGGVKPEKGFVETAARWFGLLGVISAAAVLVLVPVSVEPDTVLSNPGVAYYRTELKVFLMIFAHSWSPSWVC